MLWDLGTQEEWCRETGCRRKNGKDREGLAIQGARGLFQRPWGSHRQIFIEGGYPGNWPGLTKGREGHCGRCRSGPGRSGRALGGAATVAQDGFKGDAPVFLPVFYV